MQLSDISEVSDQEVSATKVGSCIPTRKLAPSICVELASKTFYTPLLLKQHLGHMSADCECSRDGWSPRGQCQRIVWNLMLKILKHLLVIARLGQARWIIVHCFPRTIAMAFWRLLTLGETGSSCPCAEGSTTSDVMVRWSTSKVASYFRFYCAFNIKSYLKSWGHWFAALGSVSCAF